MNEAKVFWWMGKWMNEPTRTTTKMSRKSGKKEKTTQKRRPTDEKIPPECSGESFKNASANLLKYSIGSRKVSTLDVTTKNIYVWGIIYHEHWFHAIMFFPFFFGWPSSSSSACVESNPGTESYRWATHLFGDTTDFAMWKANYWLWMRYFRVVFNTSCDVTSSDWICWYFVFFRSPFLFLFV